MAAATTRAHATAEQLFTLAEAISGAGGRGTNAPKSHEWVSDSDPWLLNTSGGDSDAKEGRNRGGSNAGEGGSDAKEGRNRGRDPVLIVFTHGRFIELLLNALLQVAHPHSYFPPHSAPSLLLPVPRV